MQFENPSLLYLIPLVIAVAIVLNYIGSKTVSRKLYRYMHPLARVITVGNSRRDNRRYIGLALLLISLCLLLVAAAGPYTIVPHVIKGEEEFSSKIELKANPPVVLIIDVSGSMEGEKIEIAKQALLEFLDKVNATYDIGLIAFSDHIVEAIPPTSDRARIVGVIKSLRAGGGTMYSYPLETALNWLRPYGIMNITTMVIFATDGIPADRELYEPLLEYYKEYNIPIYTIFIGSETSGRKLLKDIAEKTNGKSYSPDSIDELVDIYRELANEANAILREANVKVKYAETTDVKQPLSIYFVLASLATLLAALVIRAKTYGITL